MPSEWGFTCDEGVACTKACPTLVEKEKASSVYYKVAHDHKDDGVRTMTYQICYDGFAKGSEDCPRGGESEHEGFWFKVCPLVVMCAHDLVARHMRTYNPSNLQIDRNPIPCDAKGIF